jgi:rhodanese-related sulfurtransferase
MPMSLADLVREALEHVAEVAPETVAASLDAPGAPAIVDVREADEYDAGHVPGARHVPRGFLEVRADLEHYKRDPWFEDRSRPMILVCGGGHRSALAALALQRMGFTDVRSLAGGMTAWVSRGLPVDVGPAGGRGAGG